MRLNWVNLSQTSAPGAEPVSTANLKAYLRVTHSDDDTLIASLGVAARQIIEEMTRRSLITQTWAITTKNNLEAGKQYMLPRPRVQSISSVQYVDTNGSTQTFSTSNYTATTGDDGAVWFEELPETDSVPEPITITYVAGYGDAASDVPDTLITAIKLLVSEWYYNRSNQGDVPKWAESIISTYKVPML